MQASVTTVNLLSLATSLPSSLQVNSSYTQSTPDLTFHSYQPSFSALLGSNASWNLLANQTYKAFHEAGVYDKASQSLYISSNYKASSSPSDAFNISVLNLNTTTVVSKFYQGLASPNGGCTYVQPGSMDGKTQLLFCDQGDLQSSGGLKLVDPATQAPLLLSFYGREFASVNDVKQHYQTGDIWFTDAQYGYFQAFRPPPTIPTQVYRFEPLTGNVQVLLDSLIQPNGIEFSPDFKTLYVTDTGQFQFTRNLTGPATIYAYDIVRQKYARNKRVFAYVDVGLPDGIHTDVKGNVWVGCGDGVQVWDEDGMLLGKIKVGGGAANFAFVPGGLIIFNEYRLFKVNLAAVGREVARDFGLM